MIALAIAVTTSNFVVLYTMAVHVEAGCEEAAGASLTLMFAIPSCQSTTILILRMTL